MENPEPNRGLLMERADVVAARIPFLRRIKNILSRDGQSCTPMKPTSTHHAQFQKHGSQTTPVRMFHSLRARDISPFMRALVQDLFKAHN